MPEKRKMSLNEKMMIVLIILLIIGIISRWGYIKSEVSSTVKRYFSQDSTLIAK